ncbi:polymorphic toxin-type HINT domain-containing protein [Kribbella shirazensis]|uniref:RHS repeat-associated protein n=1 Tax=Kribbella shirazensis TaxID=1105143 RepID=A0A7X5VJC6_9ACTN|nr:RHS repeat-associated protein [Kribbella shirazensis]
MDPEAARTEFTYDDRGNLLQVKDALLRVTTAEYDAFGRPTKINKPYDGTVVRTTATDYDLNDNVTKQTAPNGAQSVSTYDAADNLLTKTLPDNNTTGRQLAYTYDVLGRKITETAPKGVATTTDPNDFVTKYTYDRIGQVLKVETPFVDTDGSTKTPTTAYEYDEVGNKVTVIDPLRNASPATDYTTKTVYDLNHRPTAVTDAAGYTSKTVYDADGLVTAEVNQTGHSKTTKYDEAGQPIEVSVPHTPIGGRQEQRVTKLAYDEAGNVTRQTRPSGRYSETVYDKLNRPIQKKSAFDTASTLYKTPASVFLQYYPTGEIKAQSEPTFAATAPPAAQWTNFTYYASGDIKTSTGPWQITATYGYNQLGQQTDRTLTVPGDDAKRTQAWGYYPDGALQSRSDTAAQQPVDIVDNADTWQTTSTGTWTGFTGGTNTQGADYRYHAAALVGSPAASDTFNWRVLPDVAGSFDVYASCPVRTDATTAATYTINHSTGAATKTVDQKACTAATPWINLGNYSFPNGVAKTITLKPSADGVVSADAIKLVSTNPVESRSFTYTYDLNGQQTEVKDNNPNAASDTFKITTDGLGRTTKVQELKTGVEKAATDYTYDLDSNVLSTNAQRKPDAGTGSPAVGRYTGYTWDVRNLVATVKAGASPTGTLDTWSYTYDGRGLRSTITKPNGNLATFTYHEDGLARVQTEKTDGGKLVSSHSLKYHADGDRSQDVAKVLKGNSSEYLDQASGYSYTPARQLAAVTKTGVEKGDNEAYEYDAAGNVVKQTIGATTSTMTYDRNRLVKTVTGGTTLNHRYDPFGRATTSDVGSQVVEQNGYDGYDRLTRQQKFDSAGTPTFTRNQTYDPFDRVVNQSEKVGAAQSVSTRYTFIGLADQVAIEEERDTGGVWKVAKSYSYGAAGENLSLVDSPVNGTTSKKMFYGANPRGDVETLTDASTGETTSTYRYTAYGQPDKKGTTGEDEIKDIAALDADIVNPYRFNSARFDGATGTYDMGFREYNPGLNRFLTRDLFNGALTDLGLGTDPWNANRYMFGGGNPISRVENGGHINEALTAGGGGAPEPVAVTIGSREVTAQDTSDFEPAYEETKSKLIGDKGGQGHEQIVGCNNLETWKVENGKATTCGWSDVQFSKRFAAELCQQPGIRCGPYTPTGTMGVPLGHDGGGVRLSGGPEVPTGGRATGGGGCFRSFSGETLVEMGDGTRKPISQVKVGDEVLATDPETGERGPRKVTHLWVHTDTLLELEVEGGTLTTTEDHPFWNATDSAYQRADQLDPGDKLLGADGRLVRVIGLSAGSHRVATAYNLTVDDIHTYYVLVGSTPVLVHNSNGCGTVGSVDALIKNLDNDVIFHYTDQKGLQGIIGSGTIRADSKGRTYVTQEMISSGEASGALFAGNPAYAGKGGFMIAIRRHEGMSLRVGEQPNELIHQGSLRVQSIRRAVRWPEPVWLGDACAGRAWS